MNNFTYLNLNLENLKEKMYDMYDIKSFTNFSIQK